MSKNSNRKIFLADFIDEFSFSKKLYKEKISFNRVAFIFFTLIFVSLIFSVKIFYYGSISNKDISKNKIILKNSTRSDITDIHGNVLAKTVLTNNVGINPRLENNKKKITY